MTSSKETTAGLPRPSIGNKPRGRAAAPARKLPIIQSTQRQGQRGALDVTLEYRKTRENKRNAVIKNYFESKRLTAFTNHVDAMKAVYFEKMKRDKMRVTRSLWELEQRKRKIMRQIYDHPCTDVNDSRNPALFYFTKEKRRRRRENK